GSFLFLMGNICFHITVSRQSIRPFSSSCAGLPARGGSEYGPLTDLPDYYIFGFVRRAEYLSAEVDEGMKRWQEKKEEEKQKEEHVKSLLLKPKGNVLLKNKK
uniref:Large ribosomal subunit protein mL52 n=1 Tax=Sinocyclocheilus anshuiensis TaxID=1608454 RepID=A0A671P4W1_9TELE